MADTKAIDPFLADITQDLKRLQKQKARKTGGVEARFLLATAFDEGEHYTAYANGALAAKALNTVEERNKLHLVFNLVSQRRHKLIGRLFAIGAQFKANPDTKDPQAFERAEVVDKLDKALDKKVEQPSRNWELLDNLTRGGVAYVYTPWLEAATIEPVPQYDESGTELLFVDLVQSETTGQLTTVPQSVRDAQIAQGRPPEQFELYEVADATGDVGCEILNVLQVCIDQSVPLIEKLGPDQAVYILWPKTQGWITEQYGEDALQGVDPDLNISLITSAIRQLGTSSTGNASLKDLFATVQGSSEPDDPPANLFVERYQPRSKQWPRGRKTCFIPNKKILYDGDNDAAEIPVVDFHFEPPTKSHWTKDYVTDLLAPQRFVNKRMSQLGEQSNATLYANLLLGAGIKATDVPADKPGAIENAVNDQGAMMVRRQEPPNFPSWFMGSLDLAVKFLNDLAGGSDLFEENKFPGQLRGPMAVPMLQEIIDTEWGPLYLHLGLRWAKVKNQRLGRVRQHYPASRTLHYTDKNQRDEVFEFHKDDLWGTGTNYTITVERGSLLPELRALREARIRERLQGPLGILYTDPRTGQLDRTKIAADLQFGDDGRESQEAQDRKLARQAIDRLWKGLPVPPVMPYLDHHAWLDELEAAMKTTEFWEASPPTQQAFNDRWNQHNQVLQQAAQAQAQAQNGAAMQSAIAQATQQAAAQVAADTVQEVMGQIKAQQQQAPMTAQQMTQAASAPERVQ
jgi:hypothetical protein